MKYIFSFRSYCYLVGISFLTVMFQSEMEQQFFFAMDRKNKEVTGSKREEKKCFLIRLARALGFIIVNVRRHHHAPGNESKVDISFYFNWRRRKMGIPPSALRCSFSLILHPFPIFIYRCMYIYIYTIPFYIVFI